MGPFELATVEAELSEDRTFSQFAESLLFESSPGIDATTRMRIVNAITNYDRRASKRKGYNHYALAHMLGAVQTADERVRKGMDLRAALLKSFNGSLLQLVLKAAGLEPAERWEESLLSEAPGVDYWRTTDSGHRIGFKGRPGRGKPVAGNPYVVGKRNADGKKKASKATAAKARKAKQRKARKGKKRVWKRK